MTSSISHIPGSYKDPAGFVYKKGGVLYRQINKKAKKDYDLLMSSGLYKKLAEKERLVSHKEVALANSASREAYKIIQPEQIITVSYPYEWSFSQLKDAALLTLEVQKLALECDMSLKDASAYNVQFKGGKPILIDTLSFERYVEGQPWVAYRQFCEHFLAPLSLAAYQDVRFLSFQRQFIDGFPLDFVSKLLPKKTFLNLGVAAHIHAHARTQAHFSDKKTDVRQRKISKTALIGVIGNLASTVKSLKLKDVNTEWGDYYDQTNYTRKAFESKKKIVEGFVKKVSPDIVLDLGANRGQFSRVVSKYPKAVISTDYDAVAVEKNYLTVRENREKNILPLVLDITNPSASIGWAGTERESFFERVRPDCILALALIHHLVITFNLPLSSVARFLSEHTTHLIVEFVPKSDSQVQILLQSREDIFIDYTKEGFEKHFSKHFVIIEKRRIKDSQRILYLMKKIKT